MPGDYRQFLRRGSLAGKRIGVDRRYFTPDYGGEPDLIAVAQLGIDAMASLGATIVEVDTGDAFEFFDAEFTVLLYEFKVQIAEYLAGLSNTSMRTLADLIDFNLKHCPEEMRFFGQEIFELAEATSGDLTDPVYLDARALCLRLTRDEGIDRVLRNRNVAAIVAPSYSFASAPAAVAGYPNIAIPVGLTPRGKPAGLWMYAGFLQEPNCWRWPSISSRRYSRAASRSSAAPFRTSRRTPESVPRGFVPAFCWWPRSECRITLVPGSHSVAAEIESAKNGAIDQNSGWTF